MTIHHIGYLVDDIENAAKEFERLGFLRTGEPVKDLLREVYILFLDNSGQVVELIQPISKTSPMYSLRKNYRNSPYHLCYETDDLQSEIENMVKIDGSGCLLMQPPQPAPAMSGCPNVAFLLSGHIGIIELVEMKRP